MSNEALPKTADDVLRCETCKRRIANLELGMVFWSDRDNDRCQLTGRPVVGRLWVTHKARRCSGDDDDWSAELCWFSSQEAALKRLADMVYTYSFGVEQLEKLIAVAWAVPLVAGRASAAKATRFSKVRT